MKPISLYALSFVLLSGIVPAHAQDESRLSDDAIRQFYKKGVDVQSGPYDAYADYLRESMSDKYEAQITSTINVPGQTPVKRSEKHTKNSLLSSAREMYNGVRGAKLDNKVTNILKSPDGKNAAVEDISIVRDMTVPVPQGTPPLAMDGEGTCHDLVTLTTQGTIQIVKSFCTYVYTVKPRQ